MYDDDDDLPLKRSQPNVAVRLPTIFVDLDIRKNGYLRFTKFYCTAVVSSDARPADVSPMFTRIR